MTASPLHRIHWWTFVVDNATELCDLLNEMERHGIEIFNVLSATDKMGLVVVARTLITESNVHLLKKEFDHAEKKTTANFLPDSGLAPTASAPLAAAVGKIAKRKQANTQPAKS